MVHDPARQDVPKVTFRLMPLGSSTTEAGNPGYRAHLYDMLKADGDVVNFVGSRHGGTAFDSDHEGHSGYTADDLIPRVRAWVAEAQPDIVTLHIGTNDLLRGESAVGALGGVRRVIEEIITEMPHVHIIVSGSFARPSEAVVTQSRLFNSGIESLAREFTERGSSVDVIDLNSVIRNEDFTGDLTHLNSGGERKLAHLYHEAILRHVS